MRMMLPNEEGSTNNDDVVAFEDSPFFGRRRRTRGCAVPLLLSLLVVGGAACIILLSIAIANSEQVHAQLLLDIGTFDGDFAFWDPVNGVLYWADRQKQQVNIYDPVFGSNTVIQLNHSIGVIVPRYKYSDSVILTTDNLVLSLNLTTGEEDILTRISSSTNLSRYTDGRCDPRGALWAGTSDQDGAPTGTLFRVDPYQSVTAMLQNVSTPGGMAWSKDKQTFYFIDSQNSRVNSYFYDTNTGGIVYQGEVFSVPKSDGVMSGMTIDTSDSLWIAMIGQDSTNGTGKIVRYDPIRQQLQETILLPVSQVTSCVFGGADLDELYITTRSRPGEPGSGGLYVAKKLAATGAYPYLYGG